MRKKSSSNTVNASQPLVDVHRVDHIHPQLGPQVRTIETVGRLEDHDSLVLGNHDEFSGAQEIFINYASSEDLFDYNTTIVNSCFSTIIYDLLNDSEHKTMVLCKN
jgi:hypothetical protein